jgi:hypothetical protein
MMNTKDLEENLFGMVYAWGAWKVKVTFDCPAFQRALDELVVARNKLAKEEK